MSCHKIVMDLAEEIKTPIKTAQKEAGASTDELPASAKSAAQQGCNALGFSASRSRMERKQAMNLSLKGNRS